MELRRFRNRVRALLTILGNEITSKDGTRVKRLSKEPGGPELVDAARRQWQLGNRGEANRWIEEPRRNA